jgi:hypothetical protein
MSDDQRTIDGRWERGIGDTANDCELDFAISYFRK